MSNYRKVKYWLYRCFLFIAILLLIGFAAVLPIDSIAQASQSQNNALNTFIVVGALVVFGLICIIILVGRMFLHKSCFKDIPRRYIPITPDDLPHKHSRELITNNMERSKELSTLFKKPKDPVIHAGLEPPIRCDDPNFEKLFPEYLSYKTCINSITETLKYKGLFMNTIAVNVELSDTFSDVIQEQFIRPTIDQAEIQRGNRFIELYESFQFSDKEIERSDFYEFINLCIHFHDVSFSRDKSKIKIRHLNSYSQNDEDEDNSPDSENQNNKSSPLFKKFSSFSMGADKNKGTGYSPDYIKDEDKDDNADENPLFKKFTTYSMEPEPDKEGNAEDAENAADTMGYFPESSRFSPETPSYVIRRNSTSSVTRRIPTSALPANDNDGDEDLDRDGHYEDEMEHDKLAF